MHWNRLRDSLIFVIVSISSSAAFSTERNDINDNSRWPLSEYRSAGACGTEEPSAALRDAHKRLSASQDRYVVSDNSSGSGSIDSLPPIQVDTWFHVVSSSEQVDLITNAMLAAQFVYLQQSYANTSIHYNLMGIDRSINDTWARNEDSLAMKRALRRGTYRTLNIYFQTNLSVSDPSGVNSRDATTSNTLASYHDTSINNNHDQHNDNNSGNNNNKINNKSPGASSSTSSSGQPNLLGFCTLPNPNINSTSPVEDYITDGCNILAATMPGGSIAHYNRGGTTVHEVGHWHGLLHTFQDQTCSPDSQGDYIADTPQQSIPTDGCPAAGTKDSCPDLPGLDAISNFMDYSSDDCYQNFTSDQAGRMRKMWETMREGK